MHIFCVSASVCGNHDVCEWIIAICILEGGGDRIVFNVINGWSELNLILHHRRLNKSEENLDGASDFLQMISFSFMSMWENLYWNMNAKPKPQKNEKKKGKEQNIKPLKIRVIWSTLLFKPTEKWSFGFISKYVGKQYLDNTSTDSKRMAGYFINSFNASFKWKPKFIKEIAFNVLVNNLFDRKYVSNGYTYSYYYRPQGSNDNPITENFYYPQAGINFLTGLTLTL